MSAFASRAALVLALLGASGSAWALDPDKVSNHVLLADDGARVGNDGPVIFAVLGNARRAIPAIERVSGGVYHGDAVLQDIVSNIASQVGQPGGPGFMVLTGDMVRASSAKEWSWFDQRFAPVLLGGSPAPAGDPPRMRGVPVAGDREAAGDSRYEGMEGAWPGIGADIGHNRVATWYAFDFNANGTRWRIMVLDSAKATLGSRWTEQLAWIQRSVGGDFDGVLVFMHDPVFDLAGATSDMNRGGGPAELIETLEDAVGLQKLRGVFSAGHHSNQVMLPDGPFGAIHVGAGGAGAPAELLRRWGGADAAERAIDVQLDPMFDLALIDGLDRWVADHEVPDTVIDQAKARGSYEGFTGGFDPKHYPIHGWWTVSLNGPTASLIFHQRRMDGVFADVYKASFDPGNGWRGAKLPGFKDK